MGAVSSSAPTTLVGSSAPAGKATKCERTTSPSVSVSQPVEHVTINVHLKECAQF